MTILHHLAKPRTIADLRRLTGMRDPEIMEHLRRLGPRVLTIKPTDPINDRAIRYQRNDDELASRDPARPPQRAERRNPDRDPDPQAVPVDVDQPHAGDADRDDRADGGRQDDRPADDRCEREDRLRRALGPFEVDPSTETVAAAIRRALDDGAYRTCAELAVLVTASRGIPTQTETIRRALTSMRQARKVKALPCGPRRLDLRIGGHPSQAWALSSRGRVWRGKSLHIAARKAAVMDALRAIGPMTTEELSPVLGGVGKTRRLAILMEMRSAGLIAREQWTHAADAKGRRRRVGLWGIVGSP